MPLKEFWYCPHQDEIFRSKEDYIKHIKESAWYRLCERKSEKLRDKLGMYIAKRQDHIRTCEELEEFIKEHWLLAYDIVSWNNYLSPKHNNPILEKLIIKPTSIHLESCGPELYLSVDISIETVDNDSIMGWYYWFLQTLGFHATNGGGYCNVNPGKWHLLNRIADVEFAKQQAMWKEEEESKKIIATLKAEFVELPKFKFKNYYYANS